MESRMLIPGAVLIHVVAHLRACKRPHTNMVWSFIANPRELASDISTLHLCGRQSVRITFHLSHVHAANLPDSAVVYTLNRYDLRYAILVASFLTLSGCWIRYAGTKVKSFPTVMFGQILIGIAQPFILSVPTYYSDLWFTSKGRISATALVSLSNPFGAALGQLINPMIASTPEKLPEMVMWVAVIGTVACLPAWFVPARPPTPPCASAAVGKLGFKEGVRLVFRNKDFLIILVLVSVGCAFVRG